MHEDLAAAEGAATERTKLIFVIVLALVVAIAIKIVGALLTIAFLIMPAAAARPLARTPEQMAIYAAVIGMVAVAAGLFMSLSFDTPGGPFDRAGSGGAVCRIDLPVGCAGRR